MSQGQLPPGFEALEPFAALWAAGTRGQRVGLRVRSRPPELEAFYSAVRELLAPALSYLDARPLADLNEADARLLDLVLAVPQVALAVEQQRDAEAAHARVQARFVVDRTSADFGQSASPSATC
ncbi:hypothetical protein I6A60_24470 [Frankia sp. AgB1.9]|uniref:hypothetical protein n=1 Tax=unclassified Frankia TaxID=2632575 RepID=UPI00193119CD|nr:MULTISPECIES: hypothetical protein [unclassified Frankia]MBL7490526.1 hypothetical protein [Frankia sp. AgW1.1]MBL7550995.1 hypothetical protein [Frankia sp. AgB1.9]MBL7621224.1 hypothetical protein [Frankia sp. AgB1.8]